MSEFKLIAHIQGSYVTFAIIDNIVPCACRDHGGRNVACPSFPKDCGAPVAERLRLVLVA